MPKIAQQPPKKQRHTLNWFKNRVGSYIIKDSTNTLFNPPVLIESLQHAKALYITQAANHTYNT